MDEYAILNFPNELVQQLKNQHESVVFLSETDLNKTFSNTDLHQLDKTEIEQIKYWESKTFGEVIFNGYD